jgi:hypothetical protein
VQKFVAQVAGGLVRVQLKEATDTVRSRGNWGRCYDFVNIFCQKRTKHAKLYYKIHPFKHTKSTVGSYLQQGYTTTLARREFFCRLENRQKIG